MYRNNKQKQITTGLKIATRFIQERRMVGWSGIHLKPVDPLDSEAVCNERKRVDE